MRVGALDLGSNTTLMLIADVTDGRIAKVICDEATVTKMGQGVHANRKFHPDALARVEATLTKYSQLIEKHSCDRVLAVATSAARDVKNGDELVRIAESLNIPVQIVSGDDEARLTFLGSMSDRNPTDLDGRVIVDVGGGSTEIIFRSQNKIQGQSFDVGSVRLTEMFVKSDPVQPSELQKVSDYVKGAFSNSSFDLGGVQEVIAVAGTPTTLAGLELQTAFNEKLIHGFRLSEKQISAWIERMALLTTQEREALKGMQPKRGEVIVSGSLILREALRFLKKSELTVSTRGVRYGVALRCAESDTIR